MVQLQLEQLNGNTKLPFEDEEHIVDEQRPPIGQ